MNVYRGQTEQINDLRAENRAIEARGAAPSIEPTPGPASNDARSWVLWWPALAGLALALAFVAVAWLLAARW